VASAETWPSLHSPQFDIDERALAIGAKILAHCAVLLAREGGPAYLYSIVTGDSPSAPHGLVVPVGKYFDPYIAGAQLTLADCAAFVHLPLVSLATKGAFGHDMLESMPQIKPYLKMLGERPAFKQVTEDRKAAQAAMKTA